MVVFKSVFETEFGTFQLWFTSIKGEFYFDLSSNWIGNPERAQKKAWALEQFATHDAQKANGS